MSSTVTRITQPTPTAGPAPSHSPPDTRYAPGLGLARFLGWFSVGLGMAEFLAPHAMARLTGARHPNLVQAFGLREIVTGIGILNSPRPTYWLWARVGGDALDLALLGEGLARDDDDGRARACAAAVAVAGVTARDVMCAAQLTAAETMEG